MRKPHPRLLPPLLALLLLLAACGQAPGPTPASSPTPAVTATPSPTPERPAPLEPLAAPLPPTDFAVASAWYAEGFGTDGRAFLLLGAEEDGALPFRLYVWQLCQPTQYRHTDVWDGRTVELGGVCRAEDGGWTLTPGPDEQDFPELSAGLSLEGDTLRLDYALVLRETAFSSVRVYVPGQDALCVICRDVPERGYGVDVYFPNTFSRVEAEKAEALWAGMPFFASEAGLPDAAPSVRGLAVGDHADEALARFPNSGLRYADLLATALGPHGRHVLYGDDDHVTSFGVLDASDPAAPYLQYTAAVSVRFYLDEDGYICRIVCLEPW